MDDDLIRAALWAVEAEAAFGLDALPRGERVALEVENVPSAPAAGPGPVPASPPAAVPAPAGSAADDVLAGIAARIAECTACTLCEGRTLTVPGQGSSTARVMFVGEAPGYHEDQQGLAFVGKAGELLTKMIAAMGLRREDVFIANVLKCRPPENRDPRPDEVEACFRYLLDQIDAVRPEVVCALGGHAANNLLDRSEPMGRLRGRIFDFQGIKLVPTYHPSYLLRSPGEKRKAWDDLKVVMKLLDL